jgi:outer membrane lipoprotein-sorting protein
MYRIVLLALLVSGRFTANCQYPGYKLLADDVAFRGQFVLAAQKTNSIKSDFTQDKSISLLSEKIISSGKFWFKKDNLLRMEYEQPFQYLMVINNTNVYIKDGQKETRLSSKSNKLFQQINSIMLDCVKGTALGNPDFSVRIFEGKNSFLLELTPVSKNLKEYFKTIALVLDKKDYSANSIEMNEISGDYTTIHFINKELNATIPDQLFAIH